MTKKNLWNLSRLFRKKRVADQNTNRSRRRAQTVLHLAMERLEPRNLLASDWQNPLMRLDVDNNAKVSPLDALIVINAISRSLRRLGGTVDFSKPVGDNPYLAENGDSKLTALDALNVINYIARRGTSPELTLQLKNDTGSSAQDTITSDIALEGSSAIGSAIKARIDRGPVVEIPMDGQGKFIVNPSIFGTVPDGTHTVTFAVSNGGPKQALKNQSFTLDTLSPPVSIPQLQRADDTGMHDDDNITSNSSPHVKATTEPGAIAMLMLGSKVLFSGSASAEIVVPTGVLTDGTYPLSLTVVDVAGNAAPIGNASLVIDSKTPAVPAIDLALTSDSDTKGDRATSSSRVTLQGTTEANTFVSIEGNAGVSRSSGDGSFQVPNLSLALGSNLLKLTATDLAGNFSTGQQTFTRVNATSSTDPVLRWNQANLAAIQLDASPPPIATRGMAMMSIAMLDVINSIEHKPSFLVSLTAPTVISTEAAVSTAAFTVLKYLYPAQQASLDAVQSAALTGIAAGTAQTNGISFGALIANTVISLRDRDGWNRFIDYQPSSSIGKWQETAPMYALAAQPQWAQLQPFAIADVESLLPGGPPDLSSKQNADAVNEVQSIGSATSTTRTADQTQSARFWADGGGTYTPPGHWNQIAAQISAAQGLSLGENARLFAMLNISFGDASIAAWDAKYKYESWRPITAIRSTADDGNAMTISDANWRPLLITPAHPEYVSGHSTYSAAAATILSNYFGSNVAFSTTSPGLPGVTRSFTNFNAAAAEAGRSRIYGGIHFEFSNQDGQTLGRNVADEVLKRFTVADDKLPPQIIFDSPSDKLVTRISPTISGRAIDNLAGVASATAQLDSGTSTALTLDSTGHFTFKPTLALSAATNGPHVVHFQAKDKSGLVSESFDFNFTLDTLVPTITVTSVVEGAKIAGSQNLIGTADGTGSPLTSLVYQIDSGSRMPISVEAGSMTFDVPLDLSRLAIGAHTIATTTGDAAGLLTTVTRHFTLTNAAPFTIQEFAPESGASDVGSTFRPKIVFSRPIKTSSLNGNNFFATDTTGAKLPATIVPANDGSFAWLFPTNPMPGGSTISVHVLGDSIVANDGTKLDADADGVAGGEFTSSFTTVSLAPLPGTSLAGKIVGPGLDLVPMTFDDIRVGPDGVLHTSDDLFLNPIGHVKVYVLGFENEAVFTDANGLFHFDSVPAGKIKLAIDGRTATNAPNGFFYPEMVMDLDIQPVQSNTVMGTMGGRDFQNANLDRTEMYLPLLQQTILTNVSSTAATTVGVDAHAAPNLTPAQQSQLKLLVQPGSLIGPDGQPVANGQVGVSMVPQEFVRDMLPEGLRASHAMEITIQAPGTAAFSTPVQISFPNTFNAAPGTKVTVMSFDHTTGLVVPDGTGTVSADGLTVVSDPESGIRTPGWHFFWRGFFNGSSGSGEGGCKKGHPADPSYVEGCKARAVANYLANLALAANENYICLAPIIVEIATIYIALEKTTVDVKRLALLSQLTKLHRELLECKEKLSQAEKEAFLKLKADIALCKLLADPDCGGINSDPTASVKSRRSLATADEDLPPDFDDEVLQTGLSEIHRLNSLLAAYTSRPNDIPQSLIEDVSTTFQSLDNSTTDGFSSHAIRQAEVIERSANAAMSDVPRPERTLRYLAEIVTASGDTVEQRGITDAKGDFQFFVSNTSRVRQVSFFDTTNQSFGISYPYLQPEFRSTIPYPQFLSLDETFVDTDNDGLKDIEEHVIGTAIGTADTDHDGISDLAELQQGLDPLGGRTFPTGVIASLPIPGSVREVVVGGTTQDVQQQTGYVAAGTGGLAIVDASQFNKPLLVSQLTLLGDSTDVDVDSISNVAVVAANDGGLHFVDVSDPMRPNLIRTANVVASQVEVIDGIAYAAVGSQIVSCESLTGDLLNTLNVPNGAAITGMTHERGVLYTMDANRSLRAFEITDAGLDARGSVQMTHGGGKISVSNGVVYAAAQPSFLQGGFATANVANINSLVEISGSDVAPGFASPGDVVVANGSGLALVAGSALTNPRTNAVAVMDVRNPANTDNFVTQFNLPAPPLGIAIASGIGYVADGTGGLQVINYVGFDNKGLPPTATITGPAGANLQEGSIVPIRVSVTDDVQVRSVELLMNGQVVVNDVSAPFDLSAVLPTLEAA